MKLIYLILLSFFTHTGFGQTTTINQTVKAIDAGDASKMAHYFDKVVDLTLDNEQSTYSRPQAAAVLQRFFDKNTTKSFVINHQAFSGNSTTIYLIGTLYTGNGARFRVYLLFKQGEQEWLLEEIRIEQ